MSHPRFRNTCFGGCWRRATITDKNDHSAFTAIHTECWRISRRRLQQKTLNVIRLAPAVGSQLVYSIVGVHGHTAVSTRCPVQLYIYLRRTRVLCQYRFGRVKPNSVAFRPFSGRFSPKHAPRVLLLVSQTDRATLWHPLGAPR